MHCGLFPVDFTPCPVVTTKNTSSPCQYRVGGWVESIENPELEWKGGEEDGMPRLHCGGHLEIHWEFTREFEHPPRGKQLAAGM